MTRDEAFKQFIARKAKEIGSEPDEEDLEIARELFDCGALWQKERDIDLCKQQETFYIPHNMERRYGAHDCANALRNDHD